jgi:hypothetical protein
MGRGRRRGNPGPGPGILTGAFAIGVFVFAFAFWAGSGCSDDCCDVDSFAIPLMWAPPGVGASGRPAGLLALASWNPSSDGVPFVMSIDTGSPLTVSNSSADGTPETVSRSFDILGPLAPPGPQGTAAPPPVRARFAGIDMLPVPLGSVGDQATQVGAVFGGDLLRAFSVEFHFGAPSMTFWPDQRADDGFLEDVGYAVLHFTPFGGGEITANGPADFLGLQGPIDVPPTRVLFRGCITPQPFDPNTAAREACCQRGDAVTNAIEGTPLSLLLSTGVGPLVLSRSAWNRLLAKLGTRPPEIPGQLFIAAVAAPLSVGWSTLPATARLALVNQESSDSADPGPCVELYRSRRIEWVAVRQAMFPEPSVCVQPCDTDPNETDKAQSSAAYVELGGAVGDELPVAVVDDEEPFLQGLRTDIRPEGPELDGIVGAGVLGHTRLELDYQSTPMRAIFSCEGTADRNLCFAAARCPRLPDHSERHTCFNQPLAGLPDSCGDDMCGL